MPQIMKMQIWNTDCSDIFLPIRRRIEITASHRTAALHGEHKVIRVRPDERIVLGTELAEPADTTREDILAEAGYQQTYDIDEIITRMPTLPKLSDYRYLL